MPLQKHPILEQIISLHIEVGRKVCYLWFPKVTLHLNIYDSLPGVVFGGHSSNLFDLTIEYVHADGTEH